eukprot:CAMPEP_0181172286 /NCGR_PEP_ID=MMETSP1096-20121128/2369_1 /TAXON_ID=156174 ORGANISM="Chrysochromulina ericina, Strain CCMP281" /NCGR_SAMPLE_ID=MMETSP1096 /ASSEMBLY_ACC=CAM_ASM_000453 /LENGTH=75 /DNA_ID=CAMNT_0023260005 /DNA_START=228 /DNA_END=455 /DNA_ORIENTATION=+
MKCDRFSVPSATADRRGGGMVASGNESNRIAHVGRPYGPEHAPLNTAWPATPRSACPVMPAKQGLTSARRSHRFP